MDGRWWGALALALGCAACSGDKVKSLRGDFWTDQQALTFERTWVGHPRTVELRVFNTHRMPLSVQAEVGAPFSIEADELNLSAGGERVLRVRFEPDAAGDVDSVLTLRADALELRIPVTGAADSTPKCEDTPCTTSVFDPATGTCRSENRPNGAACTSACVDGGVCQEGLCVGQARSCDDGNACTTDACDASSGCVNVDASAQCGAPEDPCRAARCDPVLGCVEEDVADGTLCGAATCGGNANVCVAGACVTRTNPGTLCTTGCGIGTCQNDICVGDTSQLNDTCTLATREVYLHSSEALYVDPLDGSGPELIGELVSTTGESVYLVDLAVHPDGRLFGISNGWLYVINSKTAECTRVGAERDAWAVGMTFLPDGRLVIAGAGVHVLDAQTGTIADTLVPDGVHQTSGDVLAVPDGRLLWTIQGPNGLDLLMDIDPSTKAVTTLGVTGAANIWGLAWARGEVLGYTGHGRRVTLDRSTGAATDAAELGTPWFGATTHPWFW